MATSALYNGQDFPRYVFTDKVKSYLFLDFDAVFIDQDFWNTMKGILETERIMSIVIENLDPDYHFNETIVVEGLPSSFVELARTENLEGYFNFQANLHMITIKTLIYSEDVFCIVLDRNYSIGIIGFADASQSVTFKEYSIDDVRDYLKVNFAGKELPNHLKDELNKNWRI